MDRFLETNKQFFEPDKDNGSPESDIQKKRILRVKKVFLPFWMRKYPEDAEGLDRKTIRQQSQEKSRRVQNFSESPSSFTPG